MIVGRTVLALLALLVCAALLVSGLHIVVPLPRTDFDPTEVAVPWATLKQFGHTVAFATPDGSRASADPVMLTGDGLGPVLRHFLTANAQALAAYEALSSDPAFLAPMPFSELGARGVDGFDALLLPGGHAQGMVEYLESEVLQTFVAEFFASGKPTAAICHGVLVLARSRRPGTRLSSLDGRRSTALPEHMELLAERLVNFWAFGASLSGSYYRTYPNITVEAEVRAALGPEGEFEIGPGPWSLDSVLRDSARGLSGFVLLDGAYVSARWPGDANTLAHRLNEVMWNYPYPQHDEAAHFAMLAALVDADPLAAVPLDDAEADAESPDDESVSILEEWELQAQMDAEFADANVVHHP